MTPCKGCCIFESCIKKHDKPTSCNRPVLLPTHNISKDFANIGRKRIAIGGSSGGFGRMARAEHKIRLGLVEGWE